jgi:hypothetical protein
MPGFGSARKNRAPQRGCGHAAAGQATMADQHPHEGHQHDHYGRSHTAGGGLRHSAIKPTISSAQPLFEIDAHSLSVFCVSLE